MVIIMRRFKTHSSSSTTNASASNRKPSSVSGLFKSASSPTPPSNFNYNITNDVNNESNSNSNSDSAVIVDKLNSHGVLLQENPPSASVSYHQRSAALIRSYGRAINRSLQYGIGYMSGHQSGSHQSSETQNSVDMSEMNLLDVVVANDQSNHNQSEPSKSPSSPRLQSRFKFTKSKTKSKNEEADLQGSNTEQRHQNESTDSNTIDHHQHSNDDGCSCKKKVPFKANATESSQSKCTKVMNLTADNIERKHSKNVDSFKSIASSGLATNPNETDRTDGHPYASDASKLDRIDDVKNSRKQSISPNKSVIVSHDDHHHSHHSNGKKDKHSSKKQSVWKLKKMIAMEINVPNDIVYEEGDNNKVNEMK